MNPTHIKCCVCRTAGMIKTHRECVKVAAHTSPRGFSSASLYACLWIRWQEEVNNPFRFVLSYIPRHCKSLSHTGPLFLPQLSSIFSFSFSAKTTLGSKTYLNLLYQVCLAQLRSGSSVVLSSQTSEILSENLHVRFPYDWFMVLAAAHPLLDVWNTL